LHTPDPVFVHRTMVGLLLLNMSMIGVLLVSSLASLASMSGKMPHPTADITRTALHMAVPVSEGRPASSRRALQGVCAADIVGPKGGPPDGKVDVEDLLKLLAAFGRTGAGLKADIVKKTGSKNSARPHAFTA
jgi:hypothetical protein